MKIITNNELPWAKTILSEITSDSEQWWCPINDKHQIFEQSFLKFVNRNLNYYNISNMLLSLIEGYQYNKSLTKTLDFCNYSRNLTNDQGPFGRMCVWNIPPGAELLSHRDKFKYHYMIVRNIFIVSDHDNNNSHISIQNKTINYNQGTLFQFQPAIEEHAFKNNSDKPWYFLGFDFWNTEMLFHAIKSYDLSKMYNNSIRQQSDTVFGIGDCKYMSND